MVWMRTCVEGNDGVHVVQCEETPCGLDEDMCGRK